DTGGGILEKASLNGSLMDRCGMTGFTCTLTNLTQRYIADGAGSSVTIGDNQQGSTVSRPTNGATASVNNNTGTKISYASVQEMNPGSDSTTAIKITNAAGSLCSETIDTTNQRVRIGDCTAPGVALDVTGSMRTSAGYIATETTGVAGGIAGASTFTGSTEDHLLYQNLNNAGAQPIGVRGILTSTYTNGTTTAQNNTAHSLTVPTSPEY